MEVAVVLVVLPTVEVVDVAGVVVGLADVREVLADVEVVDVPVPEGLVVVEVVDELEATLVLAVVAWLVEVVVVVVTMGGRGFAP